MRKLAPELDPLRIGTGWKREDLSKPQIFIESTYGDSHPGSGHLNILVEEVRKGVAQAGGFGARYYVTDICDGESQGTDGINFSLASREMIANMIEIQGNATVSDAGVYLASCDKGMPGNLMGLARVNIPSVVVPGGTMNAGPEMLTLEQLGMYSAKYQRGEIDEEKFLRAFDVNVFGAYRINKYFLPLLKNGRIVIVTSELAPLEPLPFTGIYAVTKSTLDKYAYSLRMELQLLGIKVSVLRPGAVETKLLEDSTTELDKFCESTQLYSCNAERFKRIVDSVEARSVKPEKIDKKMLKIISAKRCQGSMR